MSTYYAGLLADVGILLELDGVSDPATWFWDDVTPGPNADALVDSMGATGEFAIVSSTATATNQNTWNTDIHNDLSQAKYAGLKLDKIYFGNDDAATSAQVESAAALVPRRTSCDSAREQ